LEILNIDFFIPVYSPVMPDVGCWEIEAINPDNVFKFTAKNAKDAKKKLIMNNNGTPEKLKNIPIPCLIPAIKKNMGK